MSAPRATVGGMRIYRADERPDVEVLVDGTWWPGELRGTWTRDGQPVANVSWRTGPGL